MSKGISVGHLHFGKGDFFVAAGPCSIESYEQFLLTSQLVKNSGASLLRGGMYKLRTSPESFQGLGDEAYQIATQVKGSVGLPFVSEVTDPRQIEALSEVVDMFQVGSRNMHNYALLKELGQVKKPVMIKRGFSGTIKEWLLSAEYVIKNGNADVILCERGIRTFETSTRNTFDLNAVAYVKAHTDFTVIADPSHATGSARLVIPMALAAAAAGADGLIVEVHPEPSKALSDSEQALSTEGFHTLMEKLEALLPVLNKKLLRPKMGGSYQSIQADQAETNQAETELRPQGEMTL